MGAAIDGRVERRRRVAIFEAYPHVYGGAQRSDHLLGQRLPADGWDVVVLTPGEGVLIDRLDEDAIEHTVVPAPPSLLKYGRATKRFTAMRAAIALPRYWLRVRAVLRRIDPAVVVVVDHRGLLLAGPAAALARRPVVWQIHGIDRTRWINRIGVALARVVLVPSEAVVSRMPPVGRARRVVVVHNAVPDGFRQAAPCELAPRPDVVTMGRLHPDKGLDVLVDAFATVHSQIPDARLRVIGEAQLGHEQFVADLRTRIEQRGLGDAVELTGFLANPRAALADARVYVQAARERTEILPLAILEAMAIGVPVVATDVGGVRDVVHDGVTGRLVPPEDSEALAHAIVQMLRDAPFAETARVNAHRLVGSPQRAPEALSRSYRAVLDEVVQGA